MHYFIRTGEATASALKILLQAGANPWFKNRDGKNSLEYLRILKQRGLREDKNDELEGLLQEAMQSF